jgi:glycosyltransferase involved in cell wall biosynthesis
MGCPVVINWSISSFFGWGVYGLNLALQWSTDPDIEVMTSVMITDDISVDPIQRHALQPFISRSKALQNALPPLGAGRSRLECPVLSDIDKHPNNLDYVISGSPTIGIAFFDTTQLSAETIAYLRSIPVVVAGSDWNKCILTEYGLGNVVTVVQGIDPAQFHPAPAGGWLGDKFCVFTGGKLEFRKAQDIVLAAFRVFASRHKEALLVTAWHCPWLGLAQAFEASKLVGPVPLDHDGHPDIIQWAAANGIDKGQILDLGAIPNQEMPSILREMDVAVFPNRCEGGTNLVAMECMACGLPVILARNTGHLDLMDEENCFALEHQSPLEGYGAGFGVVAGWGESSVEEVVENLELVFAGRSEARRRGQLGAKSMTKLTWAHTAERLKGLILGYCR